MPFYKVRQQLKAEEGMDETRVIEAANTAQAIAHVVKDTITCELCTVPDAMVLAKEGVTLEKAE